MADTREVLAAFQLPAIGFRAKWRGLSRGVGIGLLIAAVGWLVAIPLAMVIWGTFRDGAPGTPAGFTLNNFVRAYYNVGLLQAIQNSLIFASGASLISFCGGTVLAWITERTDAPLRRVIYALVLVPVIVPGILFATSWLFLLNPTIGALNKFAAYCCGIEAPLFNAYTMTAMIWAEGVDNFSLPFLLMAAAFRSMDPSLEEAAQTAGAGIWTTLRTVTLPVLLPAVLATLLLSFIRAIESFEAPAIMGIPAGISVFATEVWLSVSRTRPADFNLSATFAMGYLVVTIVGVYLYHRATKMSERYVTVTGKGYRPNRVKLGTWRWPVTLSSLLVLAISVLLPLSILIWTSLMPFYMVPSWQALPLLSLQNYRSVLELDAAYDAFINNLVVGASAAALGTLLAAVIGWVVIRTRLPGRRLLDILAFAPIAIPGTVMGIALLWLYLTLPIPIYGTLWILLVGFLGKYMTFAVRSTYASLTQIHKELEEASTSCGAPWAKTFFRVTLPLMAPGLLIGFLFILSLSFRVLGLPVMISHVHTRMMPSYIFTLYDEGKYEVLSALGVMIMLFLLVIAVISRYVSAKFGVQESR
jgi:iron(III) transport system permease protein